MRAAKSTAAVFVTLAGLFAAGQALAQTPLPAGNDPVTGARPGNVVGTGNSLPMSNNASNITPTDARSAIAPRLPSPNLNDSSSPRDFLVAARSALAANRTGEAQEALERAESRALAGNVLASRADAPSQQPIVQTIATARMALARGDKTGAIQAIDQALGTP